MSFIEKIGAATMAGDRKLVTELTRDALEAGTDIDSIIQEGFIPAMATVGEEFSSGKRYIPEMLLAARAMQQGMELIKPLLVEGQAAGLGRVVLGTVQGDLHDIGKNLLAMMMEGSGLEVMDLGVDVAPEKFVSAVAEHKPGFVALSALLTTTMPAMKTTIDALEEAGLRKQVKVLIGGAPVNQDYADRIGADGYGADANEGVKLIKTMIAG